MGRGLTKTSGANLRTRLTIDVGEIHRRAEVRRTIAVSAKELHHRIPSVVAGASGAAGGMVRDPGLGSVGALEEGVMAGAVVAVGRGQDAAGGLGPRGGVGGIRGAVPRQQAQAIAGGPAVRGRVRQIRLAAPVQRRRPLVDGRRHRLPRRRRLRDDADRPRQRRVVRPQLLDAQRLRRHPVETREHEIVAEAGAQRRGVDGPLVRQLPDVRERVPGRSAAFFVLSVSEWVKNRSKNTRWETAIRTLQDVQSLAVEIARAAGGEVDVPGPVEVVDLGRPDIGVARGVGAGVDDLFRGRREARDGRRARDLHVRPRRRHEVIIAPAVRQEGVGAAGAADRVRPRRGEAHRRRQAQESPEHLSQAHCGDR